MSTDDSIQSAAQVFENMTEEEATAWLAAGDYTSVAGIPLPEEASRRIEGLVSGQEVEGFSFDFNAFAPVQTPVANAESRGKRVDVATPKLLVACCTGAHYPNVKL